MTNKIKQTLNKLKQIDIKDVFLFVGLSALGVGICREYGVNIMLMAEGVILATLGMSGYLLPLFLSRKKNKEMK